MPSETTYSQARANLGALCDKATATRKPIIIRRRGSEDVALVSAAELRSLMETAHLLRSAKNARRLLAALTRARGKKLPSQTVDALRRELGLGEAS